MNSDVLDQVTREHMCALRREAGLERQLRRAAVGSGRPGLMGWLNALVQPARPCAAC